MNHPPSRNGKRSTLPTNVGTSLIVLPVPLTTAGAVLAVPYITIGATNAIPATTRVVLRIDSTEKASSESLTSFAISAGD